jgi:hypothetical protein
MNCREEEKIPNSLADMRSKKIIAYKIAKVYRVFY